MIVLPVLNSSASFLFVVSPGPPLTCLLLRGKDPPYFCSFSHSFECLSPLNPVFQGAAIFYSRFFLVLFSPIKCSLLNHGPFRKALLPPPLRDRLPSLKVSFPGADKRNRVPVRTPSLFGTIRAILDSQRLFFFTPPHSAGLKFPKHFPRSSPPTIWVPQYLFCFPSIPSTPRLIPHVCCKLRQLLDGLPSSLSSFPVLTPFFFPSLK